MFEFQSKHYDPKTDDLFLVYTAIDESFNANGWKVEDIDQNITSGLGRPGVIKPKDPTNPLDRSQEGNFVHPEFPGASLLELLQGQEAYSIARAVRLDKPKPGSDWRVWLHVTDPKAKLALKNASTTADYPRFISPQVITFPADFPDEDKANSYKHWIISHWAFVDVPAYGEKMQIRGNCYGHINNCKIKLQNASTAGFCVTGAIKALSSSSHNTNSQTQSIMSEQTTSASPINSNSQQVSSIPNPNSTGQVYSWQPVQVSSNNNPTPANTLTTPSKQEAEPESDQKPGLEKGDKQIRDGPPDKEEPKARVSGLPESVPELQNMVSTLQEAMRGLQKDFATIKKDNDIRKQTEQRYYAASKVARYGNQFKSKDAFEKEVDVALRYSSVMSEPELEQYLADKFGRTVAPIAKSAAVSSPTTPDTTHEVPDFKSNNASSGSSDNNRKYIEVMDMFDNNNTGGV